MKKLVICLVLTLCIFGISACEKVEDKVYEGSAVDTYNNENNTATAKITVDATGKIIDVYLDTTYNGSTKKTLGDDYNMKKYNPDAAGEWYEQVEKLEQAIIEHQGVDFLELDENGKVDTVAGCTIQISPLVEAVKDALSKVE